MPHETRNGNPELEKLALGTPKEKMNDVEKGMTIVSLNYIQNTILIPKIFGTNFSGLGGNSCGVFWQAVEIKTQ